MRIDNSSFEAFNKSRSAEMRIVIAVAFDAAATDWWYFTSHADALLPAAVTTNYTHGVVRGFSGTSQKLNVLDAVAQIGNVSFSLIDYDAEVSTVMAAKRALDKSMAGSECRVYIGYVGQTDFDTEYVRVQTQIIDRFQLDPSMVYSVQCRDSQRFLKKKGFVPKSFRLRADVDPDDTIIPIYDGGASDLLDDLEPVWHDAGYTHRPNELLYYFRIEDELCCARSVDTTAGAKRFVNVERGVLGTKAVEHKIDPDASLDNQPEVSEVLYFEGPVMKIAYAVLTGVSYGDGYTWPSNWSTEVDLGYVATSEWASIGADLWDTADPTKGPQCRFVEPDPQDYKKFIEQELLLMVACYQRVRADGQLGVRRAVGVLSGAGYVAELTADNITRVGPLRFGTDKVENNFKVLWNWEPSANDFTRKFTAVDAWSVGLYKKSRLREFKFKGLHGSKTSRDVIVNTIAMVRDRFASEPIEVQVGVDPTLNDLEVGDTVRLNLDATRDYTGEITSVDRVFEVQGVRVDWVQGDVLLDLVAASSAPGVLELGSDDEQPDSWYQSEGTDLSTVLTIDGSGNIADGQTLTGGTTMQAGLYYYIGDLTLPAGRTLTITNNVQIRAAGFQSWLGKIDGAGGGHAGGVWDVLPVNRRGVAGYVGSTKPDGSIQHVPETTVGPATFPQYFSSADFAWAGLTVEGTHAKPPALNLQWASDGSLQGVDGDMRPTSGSAGGGAYSSSPLTLQGVGGRGGNGGASLLLVGRGITNGETGEVDLSGEAGQVGGSYTYASGKRIWAGSGASGRPGVLGIVIDGSTNIVGTINLTADMPAPLASYTTRATDPKMHTSANGNDMASYFAGFGAANASQSNLIMRYLPGTSTAEADTPAYVSDPTNLQLAEVIPSDWRPGRMVNVEATTTDPTEGNFQYTNYYYRLQGDSAWILFGKGPGEHFFTVPGDGSTYQVEARAVSRVRYRSGGLFGPASYRNEESPSGPRATITVSSLLPLDQVAAPTGLQAASGGDQLLVNSAGVVVSTVLLTWSASTTPNVVGYDVQFKKSTDTDYETAPRVGEQSLTRARIAGVVDGLLYDIRVRAVTLYGYASDWVPVQHTVIGKTEPPADVPWFSIDGNRLTWGGVADLDLAGYVIRYQNGDNVSFGNAAPLHDGYITTRSYSADNLPSGQVTLMIKAVDTSGNYSQSPAVIKTNLGDAPVANVFETFDEHAGGFPGVIVGGTINGGTGDLEANSQTPMMWSADAADMWGEDSSALMWATVQYAAMTYETQITPTAAQAGSYMTVDASITGDPWTLLYRRNGPSAMWDESATTPMWTDDAAAMWNAPEYVPWPGQIEALNEPYDFKIVTGQSVTRGVVDAFTIRIDVPDIVERFDDVAIGSSGTRLAIAETYNAITNVLITLQDDGGSAATVKIIDKDAALGPLVKCFNSAGSAVTGTIDATIKGY